MMTNVEITTNLYECAHRRKPRGFRLWYFRLPGDLVFSYAGTYAEAKQAACVQARRRHRGARVAIHVCA